MIENLRENSLPRRAFTLIEVLIVVGVIGVLVAILIPAVQKVREQANRAKCAAQLRQIGQVFAVYDQIYRSLPNGKWNTINHLGPVGPAGSGGQHVILRDKFGLDAKTMFCPSADFFTGGRNWAENGDAARMAYNYIGGTGQYPKDMTDMGWGGTYTGAIDGFLPTRTLRNPRRAAAESLIMADYCLNPDYRTNGATVSPSVFKYPYWPLRSNHQLGNSYAAAGSNILFADMHVEWHNLTPGKSWMWGAGIYWSPTFPPPSYAIYLPVATPIGGTAGTDPSEPPDPPE